MKFMKRLSAFTAANQQLLSEGGLAAGAWSVGRGAWRVVLGCGKRGLRIRVGGMEDIEHMGM